MEPERSPEARALTTLRTDCRLTQKALAEASGIHNATISSYERGHRPVGPENLTALLRAMGLPPRAWEATVRHYRWLDYLSGASADELPTIEVVAESFGREVERHVVALLRVLRQRPGG